VGGVDVLRGEDLLFAARDRRLVYMFLSFHNHCGLDFLAACDVGKTTFDLFAALQHT